MCWVFDIFGCVVFMGGISKLFDIELYLCEGKSDFVICIDCQFNELLSYGMVYLILCKFLFVFICLLCGDVDVIVYWLIDELGIFY